MAQVFTWVILLQAFSLIIQNKKANQGTKDFGKQYRKALINLINDHSDF